MSKDVKSVVGKESLIKVSVIMPVYNAQDYLPACLDSLMKQSLKELEIICVDDCSTDRSAEILKQFAASDTRVTIYKNSVNMGASHCRNLGIEKARGQYLSILDADDIFNPDMLKTAYEGCVRGQVDIGIYDYAKYDNRSGSLMPQSPLLFFMKRYRGQVFSARDMETYIFQMFYVAPWNKLFRKEFVLNSGMRFQDLKNNNDVFFDSILLTKAERIIYIHTEEPLVYYRVNTADQTTMNRDKGLFCGWEAMKRLREQLIADDRWERYRVSFHSFALENFVITVNSVGAALQQKLLRFLASDGLKGLGMEERSRNDFLSSLSYNQYRYILSTRDHGWSAEELSDLRYSDRKKNEELFGWSWVRRCRCGLWGAGLWGKSFLRICRSRDYRIAAVIDSNPGLLGKCVEGYVVEKPDKALYKVDCVIITNSRLGYAINREIKSVRPDLRLIDLDSYYNYNLKIEDCVL